MMRRHDVLNNPFDARAYKEAVVEAAQSIASQTIFNSSLGILLNGRQSQVIEDLEPVHRLAYGDIPHFQSPEKGHAGEFIAGYLERNPVYILRGRLELVGGYTLQDVTLPIRVLGMLGVDTVIIADESRALHGTFLPGELSVIKDHINLLGDNPLIGSNIDEWGPRFPDMSEPYDQELRALAKKEAARLDLSLHEVVYAAVRGPRFKTRAECKFLHHMGADILGASTVPEVIVARHMNMRITAVSVIRDVLLPDVGQTLAISSDSEALKQADSDLTRLLRVIVSHIGQS